MKFIFVPVEHFERRDFCLVFPPLPRAVIKLYFLHNSFHRIMLCFLRIKHFLRPLLTGVGWVATYSLVEVEPRKGRRGGRAGDVLPKSTVSPAEVVLYESVKVVKRSSCQSIATIGLYFQ